MPRTCPAPSLACRVARVFRPAPSSRAPLPEARGSADALVFPSPQTTVWALGRTRSPAAPALPPEPLSPLPALVAPDPFAHLSAYHPVVIEGMGAYDRRDPAEVAGALVGRLEEHWRANPPPRPGLLVLQGDPPAPRGIAAITPRVAAHFKMGRALVCLDEELADYHARDADRRNVVLEFRYSQLRAFLAGNQPEAPSRLERAVDERIEAMNARRRVLGKSRLPSYFRDFALLQEVTKAACRSRCGGLTVAHTAEEIHEFSVTGFFTVGLELGMVQAGDFVPFR